MPEKEPLNKQQIREYADNFLRWLDDHPSKAAADDWYEWRISLPLPYPVDRENDERRIRAFLVDKDCITNPKDAYTKFIELRPNGRTALAFKGGPLAYWANEDRVVELERRKLEKDATPDNRIWKTVDRLNKLLPIPTAIVAAMTLSTQLRQCSQPRSPDSKDDRPVYVHTSAIDSQGKQLTSPTDTLSSSSSNCIETP